MGADPVSIITPTYGRGRRLRILHDTIKAQTHPDVEWLIHDDSPAPSEYFLELDDPAVTYIHSAERMSIGEKRNVLAARASGGIIAHFDDDDYYSPDYLSTMVSRMSAGFDLVKLSGWFLYSSGRGQFGYWDLNDIDCVCYRWDQTTTTSVIRMDASNNVGFRKNYLGFGFSYVYRKTLWEAVGFPGILGEDQVFAEEAERRYRLCHFPDETGLCLHIVHRSSSSGCLPQYVLPRFLLPGLFPAVDAELLTD